MAGFDLFILLVLAAGLVRGLATGAVRQFARLGGLGLAFLLAFNLMRPVGEIVAPLVGVPARVAPAAGFLTVFLLVEMAVQAAVWFMHRVLRVLHLSVIDRVAGGMMGSLRMAFVMSAFFFATGFLGWPSHATRQESVLYSPVASLLPDAWKLFSGEEPSLRASDAGNRQESESAAPRR